MESIFQTILENVRNVSIPLCGLCILRLVICYLELGRIRQLREKKGRFLSCRKQYEEIGVYIGLLPCFLFISIAPSCWPIGIVLAVVLGFFCGQEGKRRSVPVDEFWRGVGLDMKRSAGDNAVETQTFDALEEHGAAGIFNAAADHKADDLEEKES